MEKIVTAKPFGVRDKVGYMFGNVANDFTFTFASMFLTVFYTDVLKINAGLVGTMFLLARVLDAFTDTLMGRIADKVKSGKGGKFKPWLLRMCGPVALASFLMYQTGMANAPLGLRIAYMFSTYLLWGSVCYTAINIPYGSMASVMSNEADDRASLSTFRGVGSLIPQVVVGVIMPMVLYTTLADGTKVVNAPAFLSVAFVLAVASVVCYLICYFMCTERVELTQKRKKVPFKVTLKTLLGNRALIGIVIVYVCFLGAQMLNQTINNYIFKDYFENTMGLTILNAVGFLPVLVLSPVAVPLTRMFGKKEIGVVASVLGAISYSLLFILQTNNMWVYVILSIVGSVGFGLFNLIVWAFISDIIDDHEVRTGNREDGTIYAVCSFSRKLGQALASGFGGWSLALIGYVEGASKQPASVNLGIYNIATLVPALLYVAVGVTLAFVYTLNKKRVLKNVEILKERRR
ncbi:MAG: MFS transporter [Clostridiales bacterium]|nr:MFS transporter [Clostridiales bacterium]